MVQHRYTRLGVKFQACPLRASDPVSWECMLIFMGPQKISPPSPILLSAARRGDVYERSNTGRLTRSVTLAAPPVHPASPSQLYVLLFECYSDRSEWKQGLDAVNDSLRCVPPPLQARNGNLREKSFEKQLPYSRCMAIGGRGRKSSHRSSKILQVFRTARAFAAVGANVRLRHFRCCQST